MQTLTTTDALADFCARAAYAPYITIDTEFLREHTYYAKLCLVQLALPGAGDENAVLVDPLVEDLSLEPLYALFRDESVVKVFHAARQDLEIFFVEAGVFPVPLFDTQVAAMVCGFGDQVSYETLVRRIANASLDKSSRFTNWSRRPLTDAQKTYALADVTHLRRIYEKLATQLEGTGRTKWVEEELSALTEPATYVIDPEEAWRRIKIRTTSPKFLAGVYALAKFREEYAQARNVPRNRVFKDDALLELASTKPHTMQELGRSRLLLREARKGDIANGILAAVAEAAVLPADRYPRVDAGRDRSQGNPALSDLLRVLLKAKCERSGVAQKLVASTQELDDLSAGMRNLPVLRGWRKEVFGTDALRLCDGRIALGVKGNCVEIIEL